VLAFLAVFGGWLGAPAVFHVPHLLHEWLHPVFAGGMAHFTYSHDHALEWILMGTSLAIAVSGWMIARRVYKRPTSELPVAPVDAAWHRLLTNKWYVDEIYEVVVIRPLHASAGWLYRQVDVKLIDGIFVLGPARMLRRASELLRTMQNGDVQTYVAAVLVGCAILLVFVN